MNRRSAALLEVCLVVLLSALLLCFFEACPHRGGLSRWLGKASLLLLVVAAIALPGRSFGTYGLLPANPGFTFKWGAVIVIAFMAPALAAVGASAAFGVADFSRLRVEALTLSVLWHMVFAGFIEKALFRGYVQTRLESRVRVWDGDHLADLRGCSRGGVLEPPIV